MVRRPALLAALAVALVLVAPAAGDNSQKIQRLHEQAAAAHQREAALNAQIADVTTKIRTLERQLPDFRQIQSSRRRAHTAGPRQCVGYWRSHVRC